MLLLASFRYRHLIEDNTIFHQTRCCVVNQYDSQMEKTDLMSLICNITKEENI